MGEKGKLTAQKAINFVRASLWILSWSPELPHDSSAAAALLFFPLEFSYHALLPRYHQPCTAINGVIITEMYRKEEAEKRNIFNYMHCNIFSLIWVIALLTFNSCTCIVYNSLTWESFYFLLNKFFHKFKRAVDFMKQLTKNNYTKRKVNVQYTIKENIA